MYGKSDNTTVKTDDNSLSGEVKNSFSNGRNVQLKTDLQMGRYQKDRSCSASPPQMNEEESLEESFEPACFEATTPNLLENDTNFLHHANNASSSDCDIDYQHSMNTAKLESQYQKFVQTSNQASSQRLSSETNETGGGKRSASQILALLGRSKGKFKPPVKESQAPAPSIFKPQAGCKKENLTVHSQEQYVGQNKSQMINSSSSQNVTFQSGIAAEKTQTNYDVVPSETATGSSSTQGITHNFGFSHVASSESKPEHPRSEVGSHKSLSKLSASGISSISGV